MKLFTISILLVMVSTQAGSAAVHRVEHGVTHSYIWRLDQAIRNAAEGDTIILECGDYKVNSLTLQKGLYFMSATGLPDCVTLDAREIERVFYFFLPSTCEYEDGSLHPILVEGMTIKGGVSQNGGALLDKRGGVTFRRCLFEGNKAYEDGAVAYGIRTAPRFEQCQFVCNTAFGEGIVYEASGCPASVDNVFEECSFERNIYLKREFVQIGEADCF